jgi:hypothetical protein
MGQGLKGAPHTYSMFTDLVFGPMPSTKDVSSFETLIKDHGDAAFAPFMDDHLGAATDFEAMYTFLHEKYFPRVAFGPICLSEAKLNLFFSELETIGFTAQGGMMRPGLKHRNKVRDWPTPTNRAEVDDFLYLTPFLRMFIPG